jgi:hypothetical protein
VAFAEYEIIWNPRVGSQLEYEGIVYWYLCHEVVSVTALILQSSTPMSTTSPPLAPRNQTLVV